MWIKQLMFIGCVVVLSACSSKAAKIEKQLLQVDSQVSGELKALRNHLKNKRVKNAKILAQYAAVLKKQKPEYTEIINALAEDSGASGPIFQSLTARLEGANRQIPMVKEQGEEAARLLLSEYESINIAASLDNYNMMLTDPINVLADMSEGKLPRVAAMAKEASMAANNSKDLGLGNQLVGNPHYGQWERRSNGTSFWAFYGQYAFFSSLLGGRSYSYGDWSRHRDYSYYHDVGRDYYSSPRQKTNQAQTETRARKNFKSQGKSFKSPYAKSKSSGSNTRIAKKSIVSAPGKFGSKSKFSSKYGNASGTRKKSSSSYSSRSSSSSRSFGGRGK